ncbi:helix-turn-helix domain-containing protein [Dickeya lacustris]|uniref:Helix-turn-helix domain-containing protein n=1 Tax=Dickeya lacustris TaxID=2259638 RepID=A0ABY8GB68_9GAMM|nr:helix-turn-helix domain-containing protein [Dickeya lacustris]WFN57256.1 helix-turn-helix domain-containing protein [Dickeya lacustris]
MKKEIIDDLITWINSDLTRPLRVKDVARKAGYSQWHFQRMFYHITRQSLGNYIRERRLAQAAHDLACTNERIIDIAMKYGYDSQQSFSRVFVKTYQITPFSYRKQGKAARLSCTNH